MLGYIDFLFLSFSGRIGRVTFWLSFLALGVIQTIVSFFLVSATGDLLLRAQVDPGVAEEVFSRVVIPSLIIGLIFMYPSFALYTKRWHDRDKSGWWSLIALVPIIGSLWMFIECGFLGGDYGANRFGTR